MLMVYMGGGWEWHKSDPTWSLCHLPWDLIIRYNVAGTYNGPFHPKVHDQLYICWWVQHRSDSWSVTQQLFSTTHWQQFRASSMNLNRAMSLWAEAAGQESRDKKAKASQGHYRVAQLPCYQSLCSLVLFEWKLCSCVTSWWIWSPICLFLYVLAPESEAWGVLDGCPGWTRSGLPWCALARCILVCAHYQLLQEMMKITGIVFPQGGPFPDTSPFIAQDSCSNSRNVLHRKSCIWEKLDFVFSVIKQLEIRRPHSSGCATGIKHAT